jgi:glycosyltransferase involved in cell wall biosynthesis
MKLSVVMVTYNHERYLAQSLASVLSQRVNFDYEIVVGEDCSTDGTRDILMNFYRRYPGRIVPLVRNRNLGPLRNIEEALAACRGQYLALIEGDDYWTCENKLQRQVDFLDAHPSCAICCHRVQIVNEMGSERTGIFPTYAAGPHTIEDLLSGNFICTCATVYRRESNSPLPDRFRNMNAGDWTRFTLIARHGNIELMDEVMAVYRIHPGGIWSSLAPIYGLREMIRVLTALDEHLEFQYTPTIRRTIARLYFEMAYDARQKGNRAETGKHLFNFIRNGGWQFLGSRRTFASFAAYAVLGSWYETILKAKRAILH